MKEAIVNSSAKYPLFGAGTELLNIKGFGQFAKANILTARGQRYKAGRVDAMIITAPSAADLGIDAAAVNVPVVAHIRVNTTRHTSEWATDFIKRGRPFIFEILVSGAFTSTDVATKLEAAFNEYVAKFNLAAGLPFTWVRSNANITVTLKDPYLVLQNTVEFLPKNLTYGVKAVTTKLVPTALTAAANLINVTTIVLSATTGLRVGDTIAIGANSYIILTIPTATTVTVVAPGLLVATVGGEVVSLRRGADEPTFDGKYLEENVRMSTEYTSDSYGISPDEKPFIAGGYTTITFTAQATSTSGIDALYAPHKGLGTNVDEQADTRIHTFTLYYLEGSDTFVGGGDVEDLVTFLIGGTPNIDTFLMANGQAAANAGAFIV